MPRRPRRKQAAVSGRATTPATAAAPAPASGVLLTPAGSDKTPAADPFAALLSDCESAVAILYTSVPALASLTADVVSRNKESVQQASALVNSTRSALLTRKTRLLGFARRLSRKQGKHIVAVVEAADVSTEQLRVWAGVAGAGGALCPDLDCALAASPLLASPRLVQTSAFGVSSTIMLPYGGELGSVATGDGLRVVSAAGPGLKWFNPRSRNEFSVMLVQADGSVPVWLTYGDVVVDALTPVGTPAAVVRSEWIPVRLGTVSVVYGPSGALRKDAPEAVLHLSVCGTPVADAGSGRNWCVRVPLVEFDHECAAVGTHVRTLVVGESMYGRQYGMAVSADEKWLVVGLALEGTLSVYTLPRGELVRTFGGRGTGPLQFNGLRRLCFAPNDNLFVVDYGNMRLQEVTLEGVFVRLVGVGEFGDGGPFCVDVRDDVIAVGCNGGTGSRVVLFDLGTGSVTSRFGDVGTAPGQLSQCCTGFRFTPDGSHVVVAESEATRLSLYTTLGIFVRCVGAHLLREWFKDVVQSVSGEYVVADYFNHRVCVFSPDGLELVRSWGVWGFGDGQFKYPTALAAAGPHLYVMEWNTGRVQVFE